MSTADDTSLGRRLWANDSVKILVALLAIYAGYLVMGGALGYSLRGQLNSLSRLTFLIAFYALLALALNLHWGYTGLFNIGIAGFLAVALYTMAMVSKPPATGQGAASIGGLGLPLPVGIVAGVLAATLLGLVVALPALRLRADYLAIVTIAMSEIVRFFYLSGAFQTFTLGGYDLGTGGGGGLLFNFDDPLAFLVESGPFDALVAALDPMFEAPIRPVLDGLTYAFILLGVFVVGYYWLLRRIGKSPFGRVLKAIREDEQVANALGKNTSGFKIKAFMLGCALMGLAGILWQVRGAAVTPNSFRPKLTFYVWVALIIGGAGSNTGSVLGGAIFAAVLFQGPRYVKNVVNEAFELPTPPGTFSGALGPLLDPLLLFDDGLLNIVPVLAYLGALYLLVRWTRRLGRRRADTLGTRVDDALGGRLSDPDGMLARVRLDAAPKTWGRRAALAVGVLVFLVQLAVLDLAGADLMPMFSYTFAQINALQLVLMGAVLIWLVRVRPEGLLGHRKEVAAGVPLLDAEGRAIRPGDGSGAGPGREPSADGGTVPEEGESR